MPSKATTNPQTLYSRMLALETENAQIKGDLRRVLQRVAACELLVGHLKIKPPKPVPDEDLSPRWGAR